LQNAFGSSPSDDKIRITAPAGSFFVEQSLKDFPMKAANGINRRQFVLSLHVRRKVLNIKIRYKKAPHFNLFRKFEPLLEEIAIQALK
jgi:hypothetical protein